MNRIAYIDAVRAFAMMLVVLGHVIVTYDVRAYDAPTAQVIYSFHTALFMFVSGWFFSNTIKKNAKTVIVDKVRQLLLPYFSWSVICLFLIDIPLTKFEIIGCVTDFYRGG